MVVMRIIVRCYVCLVLFTGLCSAEFSCTDKPCHDPSMPDKLVRDEGDFGVLVCRVKGLSAGQADRVLWYGPTMPDIPLTVGDSKFATDSRVTLEVSRFANYYEWSLIIDYLKPEDEGRYRCVYDSDRNKFALVYLQINKSLPPDPSSFRDVQGQNIFAVVPPLVKLGGNITLECRTRIDRNKQYDLSWFRSGHAVTIGQRFTLSKTIESFVLPQTKDTVLHMISYFGIHNVKISDAGLYTCTKTLMLSDMDTIKEGSQKVFIKVRMSRKEYLKSLTTTTATNNHFPLPSQKPQKEQWPREEFPSYRDDYQRDRNRVILNDDSSFQDSKSIPGASKPNFQRTASDYKNRPQKSAFSLTPSLTLYCSLSVVFTVLFYTVHR